MKYAIIIEKGDTNFGAWAPDLPGCVAIGDTVEDAIQNMKEAIDFHIEGLLLEGLPVPTPSTISEYVETSVSIPAA